MSDGQVRTVGARYPLHELEVLVGWPTAAELASATGASVAAVEKWRLRGLSHEQADRLAVRFGWHPILVWPEWLDAERYAAADVDARALRPARVTPKMGEAGSIGEKRDRLAQRRREGLAMAG